jgi:hypothetical protein
MMRALYGAVLEPPEMRAQRAAPLQIRILHLGLPDDHHFWESVPTLITVFQDFQERG